jgi:hypothetical protein
MLLHLKRLPKFVQRGVVGWWSSSHDWLRGLDGARASEHPRVRLGAYVISGLIVFGLLGIFAILE